MGNLQKRLATAILTNTAIYSDGGVTILRGAGSKVVKIRSLAPIG